MRFSLREYMKNHQEIEWYKIHHIIFMYFLIPIYVIDYSMNTEYYEKYFEEKEDGINRKNIQDRGL